MATIYKNGGAVGRIDRLTYSVLFCANGEVLRNDGGGWRRWRSIRLDKVGFESGPAGVFKKSMTAYEEKLSRLPEFASWRALVHEFPLRKRALLVDTVRLFAHDADGLWSELEDRGLQCTHAEAQRLADAYRAAVAEAGAGTHPTTPQVDPA